MRSTRRTWQRRTERSEMPSLFGELRHVLAGEAAGGRNAARKLPGPRGRSWVGDIEPRGLDDCGQKPFWKKYPVGHPYVK